MPRPRFFAPGARRDARVITLPPDEAHHLTHVVRLKTGDALQAFDGVGGEWRAVVRAVSRHGVDVELLEAVTPVAEPPVRVTLGIGWLKGAQMDTVVRDTTMLGVAAIVPLETAHVDVPVGRRTGAAVDRWQRLAIASAKQCRRAVVPDVAPGATLDALCDAAGARGDRLVMCVEPGAAAHTGIAEESRPERGATALVGPEGGWSRAEIDGAVARGAHLITLGPRTLRAEAAPVVLLSVLWSRWGW